MKKEQIASYRHVRGNMTEPRIDGQKKEKKREGNMAKHVHQ